MPLDLPDLPWSTWLIVASVGAAVALFVSHFTKEKHGLGFLVFLITVFSAFCGAVGLIKWLRD